MFFNFFKAAMGIFFAYLFVYVIATAISIGSVLFIFYYLLG